MRDGAGQPGAIADGAPPDGESGLVRGGRLRLRLISVLLLVGCLALVVTLHAHDGPEGGHDELDHTSSGGHHAVQVVGRLSDLRPSHPTGPHGCCRPLPHGHEPRR